MAKATAALFLIDGFEETEAITTVDILRRGDVEVTMVSLTQNILVQGKHDIFVQADIMFQDIETLETDAQINRFDMLIIPGGTTEYMKHEGLLALVEAYHKRHKRLAAICAAPAVFGVLGLLNGKNAVCYSGMETYLKGAIIGDQAVVTDKNITTGRGPGLTVPFALRLLEILKDDRIAKEVGEKFLAY